ncbi:TRIM56 [Branchiostoma lanceolatum]|uniref:TRIM56 protein n=1 Tax=Branchiostoma lanceolatum TaxID=7740 RepID=A0A8J9YZH9_BRALA|nr:TRIM56 [Branchiostoma lanceolatum]
MAESKLLNRLSEDFLECQICLQSYRRPKVLSCLHSFCQQCLEEFLKNQKNKTELDCPTCRSKTLLPGGGVTELKDNFFVESLKDTVDVHKKLENEGDSLGCGSCETKSGAESFCTDCGDFLCDECATMHRRMKVTRGHQVIGVEQLKAESDTVKIKPRPVPPCSIHSQETLKLYCVDCNEAICQICTVLSHKDHKYEYLADAAVKTKEDIRDLLVKTEKKVGDLKKADQQTHAQKTKLETNVTETVEKIKKKAWQTRKWWVSLVNQKETELLDYVATVSQTRSKDFSTAIEEIKTATVALESAAEFGRNIVEHGSEFDIMAVSGEVNGRLKKLLQGELADITEGLPAKAYIAFEGANVTCKTKFPLGEVKITQGTGPLTSSTGLFGAAQKSPSLMEGKPTTSTGLFSTGLGTSTSRPGGELFGSSKPTTGTGLFATPQQQTSSLGAANKTELEGTGTLTSSTGLFGATQKSPSLMEGKPTTSTGLFSTGSTGFDSPPKGTGLFGQTHTTQPIFAGVFGDTATTTTASPGFFKPGLFGQTEQKDGHFGQPTTQTTELFGAPRRIRLRARRRGYLGANKAPTFAIDATTTNSTTSGLFVNTAIDTGGLLGQNKPVGASTTTTTTTTTSGLFVKTATNTGGLLGQEKAGSTLYLDSGFRTARFTTLGTTGRLGPTSLGTHYRGQDHGELVQLKDGIQYFTIPDTGKYRIEAAGSAAGWGVKDPKSARGRGAVLRGTFPLKKGEVLKILVGQEGLEYGVGGGGGTFVTKADNTPLVVAGGAGGGNRLTKRNPNSDGTTAASGQSSSGGYSNFARGSNGKGATHEDTDYSVGGGGGGLLTDGASGKVHFGGTDGKNGGEGGKAFVNGGVGGRGVYNDAEGGFGGGGGSYGDGGGGGGGGGYSGGGRGGAYFGACGGGGGSYNSGSDTSGESGANDGPGYVALTRAM